MQQDVPTQSANDLTAQCDALRSGLAWVDRSDRALLEITGADRAAWLHNLTSNEVKSLMPGQGNYAFALTVKGRIIFDLVIMVKGAAIWLDLDRGFLESAKVHFDKYVIIEDVTVTDRSDDFSRFALAGEQAKALLTELGAGSAAVMARFDGADFVCSGAAVRIVRNDFCGPFGVDVFFAADQASETIGVFREAGRVLGMIEVGADAVQLCRIESGLPWSRAEITDEVLPAETGQFDKAVSFNKGCYLGQEIVERMRTREQVARRLVGLQIDGDRAVIHAGELRADGGDVVGRLTSACYSPSVGGMIGLGYVKTSHDTQGTVLTLDASGDPRSVTIVALPFVASKTSG